MAKGLYWGLWKAECAPSPLQWILAGKVEISSAVIYVALHKIWLKIKITYNIFK